MQNKKVFKSFERLEQTLIFGSLQQKNTIQAVPKKMLVSKFKIFVDGASRGNPGQAGAGIYIQNNDTDIEKAAFHLGIRTNNQAEYLALAIALFLLQNHLESENKPHVQVISDSELMVKQMRGEYRVKNEGLKPIKNIIDSFLKGLNCEFQHVLRSKNKIADKLANQGIDSKKKMPPKFIKLLAKYGINGENGV
jgi:ribonuclease HI